MTATVLIGGKEYPLGILVFAKMRKAWPLLRKHLEPPKLDTGTPEKTMEQLVEEEIEATSDAIKIFAISLADLHPEMTVEKIENTLTAGEVAGIRDSLTQLLVDSGLVKLEKLDPEVMKVVNQIREAFSTAISTASSPGLSQPGSKEEAGT